jgi:chemotaxis protein methyltransferase CheR
MMSAKPVINPSEPDIPVEVLAPIKALIRERAGLIFQGATQDKLIKALRDRMVATKKESFTQYHQLLRSNIEEFDQFIVLLTINETFFYREMAHFDLLTTVIIPLVRESKKDQSPIKIMSVGCSSGEEAYSIAIALCETFGTQAHRHFEIVAGDIDKVALKKAEGGQYGNFSFRGVPPHLIEKYFDPVQPSFRKVKPFIKNMVTFDQFNLLSEDNSVCFSDIDVMFYRNVSIYFDEETRKGIMGRLKNLLCSNGFLIMGSTETLANDFGILHLISKKACFIFSKSERHKPAFTPEPLPAGTALNREMIPPRAILKNINKDHPATPRVAPEIAPLKSTINLVSVEKLDALIHEERWKEAERVLNTLQNLSEKEKNLYLALIALYCRAFEEAKLYVEKVLAEDEWSVNAQIILGLVAKYQEDFNAAATYFKKAIYLHAGLWAVHYYLADCLRQLQHPKQSLRAYSQALELINKKGNKVELPNNERMLPFNISVEQVRFLCDLHMTALKD